MRCPEKPTNTTAWDWYDWALRSAVATDAKPGTAICPKETHTLPPACNEAIRLGWQAGLKAADLIRRINAGEV